MAAARQALRRVLESRPVLITSSGLSRQVQSGSSPSHTAPLARRPGCSSSRERGALRCIATTAPPEDVTPKEVAVPPVSVLDVRVGRIVEIEVHADANSLYVERVDVGEEEPRTIVSGLVKYVPLEDLRGRRVIVLCNLKPRNMRGVKSNGMLLCASDDSHEAVEPLDPPEGATVGERVWFGSEGDAQGSPETPNRIQKKKMWEALQPMLTTGADRVARFDGAEMTTSGGPVTVRTLANARISWRAVARGGLTRGPVLTGRDVDSLVGRRVRSCSAAARSTVIAGRKAERMAKGRAVSRLESRDSCCALCEGDGTWMVGLDADLEAKRKQSRAAAASRSWRDAGGH